MSDQRNGIQDLEAPESDALEQSLPVDEAPEDPPTQLLSDDLEVPEPDAFEQHQPALVDDDDSWR
jgi:hypothetical protein